MSIVRERDYWQAKRDIVKLKTELAELETYKIDARDFWWEDRISVVFNELVYLKEIVAEHDVVTDRPSDVERPASEASLDQWVSA